MTYNGKEVIRMVGRFSRRAKCGITLLEYADHTTEHLLLEIRTERGRRTILMCEAAKEQVAQFSSLYGHKRETRRAES